MVSMCEVLYLILILKRQRLELKPISAKIEPNLAPFRYIKNISNVSNIECNFQQSSQ